MRLALLAAASFVLLTALAPAPAAGHHEPPGTHCMPVYQESHIGPLTIIRRDSCHTEYYLCGRPLAEALASPTPLDCAVRLG